MKWPVIALALLIAGATAVWHYGPALIDGVPAVWQSVLTAESGKFVYRSAYPEYGNITPAVVATGMIEPVTIVQVGTQISDQITELRADFNSPVRKGEIIAVFDQRDFISQVEQAEADLDYATASLQIQKAAVDRVRAELVKAQSDLETARAQTQKAVLLVEEQQRNLGRKKVLLATGSRSSTDAEQAQFAYDNSLANLRAIQGQELGQAATVTAVAALVRYTEGQIEVTQAAIRQKVAAVKKARTDLERTQIRSPIDGTVIDRAVEVGQTLSASLESPTLFSIAQDLRQMQIKVSLDEADVGRVHEGQMVVFTVDAFPDRSFTGEVLQIRQNPQMVQYVVTYTVIVSAPNPDLLLKPGMTANAQIVLAERQNVLRVPNAALRFRPPGETVLGPHVWTLANGVPKAIPVQIGLSDETYSEVRGEISGDTAILVGQETVQNGSPTAKAFGLGN